MAREHAAHKLAVIVQRGQNVTWSGANSPSVCSDEKKGQCPSKLNVILKVSIIQTFEICLRWPAAAICPLCPVAIRQPVFLIFHLLLIDWFFDFALWFLTPSGSLCTPRTDTDTDTDSDTSRTSAHPTRKKFSYFFKMKFYFFPAKASSARLHLRSPAPHPICLKSFRISLTLIMENEV